MGYKSISVGACVCVCEALLLSMNTPLHHTLIMCPGKNTLQETGGMFWIHRDKSNTNKGKPYVNITVPFFYQRCVFQKTVLCLFDDLQHWEKTGIYLFRLSLSLLLYLRHVSLTMTVICGCRI